LWLILFTTVAISMACAWAILNGHAVIGIGVLIAVFLLPDLVLIPLRIRRSRRRAADASEKLCRDSPGL
jgi:hypothetical protein